MTKRYCDICEREICDPKWQDMPRYQTRVTILGVRLNDYRSTYYGDFDMCPDCEEMIAKAIFGKANEIRRSFPNLTKTIEEKIDAVVSAIEPELPVNNTTDHRYECECEFGCNNAGECTCEKS